MYNSTVLRIPFVWNPQIDIFPKTDFSRNLLYKYIRIGTNQNFAIENQELALIFRGQ
jgi:hypothetical protein